MGSDIADIKLTVCIGNILASTCSVTSLWPGLPKDLWELSQMLGRGGRDGSQAAFVSLVWVGQAGRLLLLAKLFAALRELFEVENPYREFLAKNIITCFNRVLLIGGGDVAVQRGVPGS